MPTDYVKILFKHADTIYNNNLYKLALLGGLILLFLYIIVKSLGA